MDTPVAKPRSAQRLRRYPLVAVGIIAAVVMWLVERRGAAPAASSGAVGRAVSTK